MEEEGEPLDLNEVFPSVECNEHQFKLYKTSEGTSEPLTLVDIPGSQRFASKFVELMPNTKLVVFVIDAAEFRVAESGSLLFKNVLLNEHFLNEQIPLIVVCNKVERNQKIVITNVKSLLESEITNLGRIQETESDPDNSAYIQRLFADSDSFSFDNYDTKFLTGSVLDSSFVQEIKEIVF